MVASAYYPYDNLGFYLFVIAVLEAQAIYTWQFRNMPGAMMASLSQACKGLWLLFLVLASISPGLEEKVFWIGWQKAAATILPYLWLIFTLKITGQDAKAPLIVKNGILACLSVLCFIFLTNWQGLFWRAAWMEEQTLWFEYGTGPWVSLLFGYLLAIINTILSVKWWRNSSGLRRKQAGLYITAVMVSWAAHALWFVALLRNIAMPLGFLLSGIIVTWLYYRWHFYNVLPRAQSAVLEDMVDGLLVVDDQGFIAELNPAAKIIFAGLPASIGDKYERLLAAWPELSDAVANFSTQGTEASRSFSGERHDYQIQVRTVKTSGDHRLGVAIVLKDITKQKQMQEQMIDQQKAMSILAERDRLGRELHDGRGQVWNMIGIELHSAKTMLDGGQIVEAGKRLDHLIDLAKKLNTDVRETIVGLKQAGVANDDFVADLQDYLAWYEKNHGILTRLILPTGSTSELFNNTVEVQLLRIIQEALTNVRKHACARQVRVEIAVHNGWPSVVIEDDGCGFEVDSIPAENKNFGLQIMSERAAEAGGRLTLKSQPGKGTQITIRFAPDQVEKE